MVMPDMREERSTLILKVRLGFGLNSLENVC